MKNLSGLMKQAQQMQAKMAEMQAKLEAMARAICGGSSSIPRSSILPMPRCWRT